MEERIAYYSLLRNLATDTRIGDHHGNAAYSHHKVRANLKAALPILNQENPNYVSARRVCDREEYIEYAIHMRAIRMVITTRLTGPANSLPFQRVVESRQASSARLCRSNCSKRCTPSTPPAPMPDQAGPGMGVSWPLQSWHCHGASVQGAA